MLLHNIKVMSILYLHIARMRFPVSLFEVSKVCQVVTNYLYISNISHMFWVRVEVLFWLYVRLQCYACSAD